MTERWRSSTRDAQVTVAPLGPGFETQCDGSAGRFQFGRNVYANHNLVILDGAPVSLGDNVWLGATVTVLPGVEIGANVTISVWVLLLAPS